jgi:hypothetical protein
MFHVEHPQNTFKKYSFGSIVVDTENQRKI